MDRIQVDKNFYLDEFICPEIYNKFGANSLWFIDKRIIDICQYLRDLLAKSITVNNWFTGGNYKESGLRSFGTGTGSEYSQHKYGRASDLKIDGTSPIEVSDLIKKQWFKFKSLGLSTLENPYKTPTWTHIDCRFTGKSELLIVNP